MYFNIIQVNLYERTSPFPQTPSAEDHVTRSVASDQPPHASLDYTVLDNIAKTLV